MEKRKPTYALASFKDAVQGRGKVVFTSCVYRDAFALGLSHEGICGVLQTIEHAHFCKSMTANNDYKMWQDVYHVPFEDLVLYVKFTAGKVTEFKLLSFKEK